MAAEGPAGALGGYAEVGGYVADARFRNFTSATIRSYESNLKRYHRFLRDHDLAVERVGTAELKRFLAILQSQGFVADTILNNFSALSSYYDYLQAEGKVAHNPVPPFRKRYLRVLAQDREKKRSNPTRQVPSLDMLRRIVLCGLGARDQALILLLLKTGMRRQEVVQLNVDDIDLTEMRVTAPAHRKRANRRCFFDAECREGLRRWLELRPGRAAPGERALFTNAAGGRLDRSGVYNAVVEAATRAGAHDPGSSRPQDRFTPHHGRHFFTSVLLNNGMSRQHVQWLRGDHAREAIDVYYHADEAEIRRWYEKAMPSLRVYD